MMHLFPLILYKYCLQALFLVWRRITILSIRLGDHVKNIRLYLQKVLKSLHRTNSYATTRETK